MRGFEFHRIYSLQSLILLLKVRRVPVWRYCTGWSSLGWFGLIVWLFCVWKERWERLGDELGMEERKTDLVVNTVLKQLLFLLMPWKIYEPGQKAGNRVKKSVSRSARILKQKLTFNHPCVCGFSSIFYQVVLNVSLPRPPNRSFSRFCSKVFWHIQDCSGGLLYKLLAWLKVQAQEFLKQNFDDELFEFHGASLADLLHLLTAQKLDNLFRGLIVFWFKHGRDDSSQLAFRERRRADCDELEELFPKFNFPR